MFDETASISDLMSELAQTRTAVLASVADWTEEQASFKPEPATWSATENIEHLYRTELAVANLLWKRYASSDGDRSRWRGVNTNAGLRLKEIVDSTAGNSYPAPAPTLPTLGGPADFWFMAFRLNEDLFDELALMMSKRAADEIIFPHFVLGPLTGRQWLVLLSMHNLRHRDQIGRLQSQAAFPSSLSGRPDSTKCEPKS